ncbi:MAG: c-type cytochrome [Burkholderiales bacterium]|nr:c-type cytochrome [Burkholderiales bacterium]
MAVVAAACLPSVSMASMELAKSKNCLACHAVDQKLVGPSYKEVSAKYKGDAGAVAKMATKIQKGGAGAWGPVPMPPHPNVSDAEAQTLAKWVLAQ